MKKITTRTKFATGCLILAYSLSSACTEEPEPTLSYKERQLVDSLFKLQVDSLHPKIDSLCKARFDSAVQHNADSIMNVRTSEIQKYLERIRQEGVGN